MARFIALFKDSAGASETPTNPRITVYDPLGTKKINFAAIATASGISRYTYNLVTATDWELGRYRTEFYGQMSEGTVRNSIIWELISGDVDS